MKNYITYFLVALIIMTVSSCYTHNKYPHGGMPPGKAKKVYGDKSAKRHAPGKHKKKPKKGKGHHKYDVYYGPYVR